MQIEKNLLLTFDYELFLGARSGTVDNCMINPTDKILEILACHKITNAIFFVDTTYLLTLRNSGNENCQVDYQKIKAQIGKIKKLGHYVFPHLHTHWLDAKYVPEKNQWDLSNIERYSFSNISKENQESIFLNSIKLLEEIIGLQTEWGYRAGGWCIQPFYKFKPFFEYHNILYDFSVLKGYACASQYKNFDFIKAPRKNYYRFNEDVLVEENGGKFIEIPISNIKRKLVTRLLDRIFIKILYKKGIKNYGDGLSTNSAILKESKLLGYEMASIELLTLINITDYIKKFEKKELLHFISHPKMLNPHNLTCLDVFLKKILLKYKINTDFKKMILEDT